MMTWNRCERRFGPLIAERAAGALSVADTAALARHLGSCKRCRETEAEMRELVLGMRDGAGSLAHPSPRELAALSMTADRLPAGERLRLEQHLEDCAQCRTEWSVASRWTPPARRHPAMTSRRTFSWGAFSAGALASASAAALIFFTVLPPTTGPQIEIRPSLERTTAPVQLRGEHHRAASDATVLPVPGGATVVAVSLTVEAAPNSKLVLTLVDGAGTELDQVDLTLDDPAGNLLFAVPAARLPEDEGAFTIDVPSTAERFRYPFRIERQGH